MVDDNQLIELSQEDWLERAKSAYIAYHRAFGIYDVDEYMAEWNDYTDHAKQSWVAVVKDVVIGFKIREAKG